MNFERKRNRLPGYDYSQNGAYFITFCTDEKRCVLRDPETFMLTSMGRATEQAIDGIEAHHQGISLEKYVIMPNHVHMILVLHDSDTSASLVVKQLKETITKRSGRSIWQKSFHDHVIRNENDYSKIWEYIDTNPQKWLDDCFHPNRM